jgi:hypothetical protein
MTPKGNSEMNLFENLPADIREEFKTLYFDLVFYKNDTTDADLALLEKAGLMWSRTLDETGNLEPSNLWYEFTEAGRELCEFVEREMKSEISTWGEPDTDWCGEHKERVE